MHYSRYKSPTNYGLLASIGGALDDLGTVLKKDRLQIFSQFKDGCNYGNIHLFKTNPFSALISLRSSSSSGRSVPVPLIPGSL